MAEAAETPVVIVPPVESKPTASEAPSSVATQPPAGPADDLREIQTLLVRGQFPGEVAPMVVKGFQFLDKLATTIEQAAKASARDAGTTNVKKD